MELPPAPPADRGRTSRPGRAQPDDLAAVHVLADAIRARRTTAARLTVALAARPKQSRRAWRRRGSHGPVGRDLLRARARIPRASRARTSAARATRQACESAAGRTVVRDVRYERYGVTVELNGRLFHDGPADWDADLERELDAAVRGGIGLRLGWGQVFSRPCRTAAAVATMLRERGWRGPPVAMRGRVRRHGLPGGGDAPDAVTTPETVVTHGSERFSYGVHLGVVRAWPWADEESERTPPSEEKACDPGF